MARVLGLSWLTVFEDKLQHAARQFHLPNAICSFQKHMASQMDAMMRRELVFEHRHP